MFKPILHSDLKQRIRICSQELNNSISKTQITFLCGDKHVVQHESDDFSNVVETVLLESIKSFQSIDSKLAFTCEILWRIGRRDIVRQYFVSDLEKYRRYVEQSQNSLLSCFRFVLKVLVAHVTPFK